MLKKRYSIYLCDNQYNEEKNTFVFPRLCELASNTSSFVGQIQNIVFYTKIDGTHELSFELSKYYFDIYSGRMLKNDFVDLLVNKVPIEAVIEDENGEDKEYFLTLNKRIDNKEGGITTYNYSCSDSFIEELSKTGYQINLNTDLEVGANGVGTIHELAQKAVEGTDWVYKKENTDTLYDYSIDLKYNSEQERYDEVYTPIPSYSKKYLPEIEGFAYETDIFSYEQVQVGDNRENRYHPIYCYKESESILSNTVRNILYNATDYVTTEGWQAFSLLPDSSVGQSSVVLNSELRDPTVAQEDKTYDLISYGLDGNQDLYVVNNTASVTNINFQKDKIYAFRYEKYNYNTKEKTSVPTLSQICLSNKSPFKSSSFDVVINGRNSDGYGHTGFLPFQYYIIKSPLLNVSKPYISFNFGQNYSQSNPLELGKIEIFEIKTKDADGMTAEENYQYILTHFSNGDLLNNVGLNKIILPSTPITAYTQEHNKYLIRKDEYYLDDHSFIESEIINPTIEDVIFLDLETEVNQSTNYIYNNGWVSFSPKIVDKTTFADKIIDVNTPYNKEDLDKIYQDSTGKYYQYYYLQDVSVNGQKRSGGKWGLALLDGSKEKIRALTIEKSNRFNIIQEISELFRVWPVFNVYRDPKTKEIRKEFWFKESCLKENFAGFHAGVNVKTLVRDVNSDEIVTKMYVEDVENEFADNGLTTIALAKDNPLGENFYYNFRYYVEQHLLDTTIDGEFIIDRDLHQLYADLKEINDIIHGQAELELDLLSTINDLERRSYQCSLAIAGAQTNIESLNTELATSYNLGPELVKRSKKETQQIQANIQNYEGIKKNYENELESIKIQLTATKAQYEDIKTNRRAALKTKKEKINAFETKYSQYIKEGSWSDTSYVDNDLYYYDSQKVSNTSAEPKISWTISVLDGSCFEELKDFKIAVGDKTFLIDPEFFDNKKDNYKFQVLIFGYKEHLDNPIQNEAEVRNFLTSFEDLFQRISAATQTLELKEQTYDKAAKFTPQGIEKEVIQDTLLNNSLVLSGTTDNTYTLDDTGLSLSSVINPVRQLRITSDGIYMANSLDKEGQPEWKTGITANGISANVLTAGKINTSEINIYCEDQIGFKWDELGITAKQPIDGQYADDSFVRLDGFGLYFVQDEDAFGYLNDGRPWYQEDGMGYVEALDKIVDRSVLSITTKGFRLNLQGEQGQLRLGQFDDGTYGLKILQNNKELVSLDTDGICTIGGWNISEDFLYAKTNDINYSFHLYGKANNLFQVLRIAGPSSYLHINRDGDLTTTASIKISPSSWSAQTNNIGLHVGSKDVQFDEDLYLRGDLYWFDPSIADYKLIDFSSGGGGSGDFIIPIYPNGDNDPVMASAWWESYSGHKGLDLVLKNGDQYEKPVYASRGGTVETTHTGWTPSEGYEGTASYGNYVLINHGTYNEANYKTRYAHLQRVVVAPNTTVSQGALIGYLGNTGNVYPRPTESNPHQGAHVHFEVIKNGVRQNPELYLPPIPHK